jgi:hypothetical protein
MNNQENHNPKNIKTINKGLIFIKSTVLMLFIVLVVLVIAFMMSKNKKEQARAEMVEGCKEVKSIMIDSEIEKIEYQGRILNVLTKFNKETNDQELIRIDSQCGNEINRINFELKTNAAGDNNE